MRAIRTLLHTAAAATIAIAAITLGTTDAAAGTHGKNGKHGHGHGHGHGHVHGSSEFRDTP